MFSGELAVGAPPKPRQVGERRETPYAGSNRFYRGRIVDALRALGPSDALALAELGPRVKPDFAVVDAAWLRGLVERLAADGLIAFDGEQARLPG